MKRIIIAMAAALAMLPAVGQTWLSAPCAEQTFPARPVPTSAQKPICLPSPAGAGTSLIVESNDYGIAGAWWCKAASKGATPTLYLYAARWEALTTSMLADMALVAMSSAKTTAIQAYLLRHQSLDIRDMCDVWGPARERIAAAKPSEYGARK